MRPLLIVPGYTNSGAGHWQSLWQQRLPQAGRVEQSDWDAPSRLLWMKALDKAIARATAPPVLIAHSLGCLTVVHWAATSERGVAGALLVAPPDVERPGALEALRGFAPVPSGRLAFASIVVASTDDPHASLDRSAAFARAWGSEFVSIGAAGHINTASGFGPWPAGEALLGRLMDAVRS